jgi:hypothetical protein
MIFVKRNINFVDTHYFGIYCVHNFSGVNIFLTLEAGGGVRKNIVKYQLLLRG